VPVACADCGCLVERGVRVESCHRPDCCCEALPTRDDLDRVAAALRHALETRDLDQLGTLLADDVRWGDDDAPNRCRSRRDVLETFQRLVATGVTGEIAEVETGPAGVLCRLVVRWPESAPERRPEVVHLYRLQDGHIVEIEPHPDLDHGRTALSTIPA